jgi:hypothetical protein
MRPGGGRRAMPEGGVNGGLRVHGLIFPHATDIYATLFIGEGPQ